MTSGVTRTAIAAQELCKSGADLQSPKGRGIKAVISQKAKRKGRWRWEKTEEKVREQSRGET